MRLRSDLMIALQNATDRWRETSGATAARLDIDAARIDDLQRGQISSFSLDDIVGLAGAGEGMNEVKQSDR